MTIRATRDTLPPAYWRLWTSTLASGLGDGLVVVAFPLLALTLTRRPLLVAGVAVAARLPALVVGPVVGALIDRTDAGRLAGRVQVAQLATFTGFALAVAAGADSLPLLYATVAVLGCCDIAFAGCTSAALPRLVDQELLDVANGRLSTATLASREVIGVGIGGVAFAASAVLPFALDAASFAVAAVVLLGALPHRRVAPRPLRVRADIAEGLRWLARSAEVRRLAATIASFAGCQSAVVAVLVLYATGPLHVGRAGYGALCAVASVGGVLGAAAAPGVARRLGTAGAVAAAGVAAGAAYLLLGGAALPVTAGIAVALESAAVSVGNVASTSMRQRLIPAELLGRVGVSFRMLLLGACAVGAVAGGALTSLLGVRPALVAVGVAQLLAVAVAALVHRSAPVIDLTSPLPHPAPPPDRPAPAAPVGPSAP